MWALSNLAIGGGALVQRMAEAGEHRELGGQGVGSLEGGLGVGGRGRAGRGGGGAGVVSSCRGMTEADAWQWGQACSYLAGIFSEASQGSVWGAEGS